MKNSFSCLLLFFVLFLNMQAARSIAQNGRVIKLGDKPVAADCDSAILLKIFKRTSYGMTTEPFGYGTKQEIVSRKKNSNVAFEKEHNSAWYLLRFYFDGEVVFELTPKDSSNDYDFILYQYTDSNFCSLLAQNKATVVRSNIRRNDTLTKGRTGLSKDAVNELQAQGPGAQYSKSLMVKKGDKYMLAVDNVYENGQGHTLVFNYLKDVSISGTVVNDDGKSIKADVLLSDVSGNTIAETKANDSGHYSLGANLKEQENYHLTFSSDRTFYASQIINTKNLKDSSNRFVNIKTVLSELKKGKKYKARNINFYGDSPEMLPESYPSAFALYKLMKKNKSLIIRIEGHVNAPNSNPDLEKHQKLSEWRAIAIANYLKNKGIENARLSTIGLSNRFMLFPNAKLPAEEAANRRVEINVLSMD